MKTLIKKIPGSSIMNINYGDHILKSVIASRWAKSKLSVLLMMFVTTIIRFHLVSIVGILISVNPYIDFITQVVLGVVFVLHTNKIYNLVVLKQSSFYKLTRYMVNNYTPERWRNWKRLVTLSFAIYIIVAMLFIEITSNLIILYTFQYIVSYMIIDIIEQKRFEKMLKKYQDKPDRTIYAEFNIMDSFYDVPDNDKKYLCDATYEKIDKPTLKKNKLSDSLGKIGFVIIDDYH